MDDFEKLESTLQMFQLLTPNPLAAIKAHVGRILREKIVGAVLVDFRVTSEPQWITSVRTPEPGVEKAAVRRSGVAFEFDLTFKEITEDTHRLAGVFTWVAAYLDEPGKAQAKVWFDVGATLATHGHTGELKKRMFFIR